MPVGVFVKVYMLSNKSNAMLKKNEPYKFIIQYILINKILQIYFELAATQYIQIPPTQPIPSHTYQTEKKYKENLITTRCINKKLPNLCMI